MTGDPKRDVLPDVDDVAQAVIDRYLAGEIETTERYGRRRIRAGAGRDPGGVTGHTDGSAFSYLPGID